MYLPTGYRYFQVPYHESRLGTIVYYKLLSNMLFNNKNAVKYLRKMYIKY